MTRTKRTPKAATPKVEPVQLTEVQEWALLVISDHSPVVNLKQVTELFQDSCPDVLPVAMIRTFLEVAKSTSHIRRAAMFMRRFHDAMWIAELNAPEYRMPFAYPQDGIKFNAIPDGSYDPKVI